MALRGKADPATQSRPRHRVLTAQLAGPLRNYLSTESGSAGLLLAATALALLWANSPAAGLYTDLWSTPVVVGFGDHAIDMDLHHWVNDGLMAIFFFVIGLEVRREISVGELTDSRRMLVPALAAAGGIILPALLYLAVNPSGEAARGWGIVIGTDTAFVLGALALVGPSFPTQLRVFILTLTVFDDIAAVAIIGLVYSESLDLTAIAVAAAGLALLAAANRAGQWRSSVYLVLGVVVWVATLQSGLHPSIAGMLAGLTISASEPRRREVERAARLVRAFRQSPQIEVGWSAKQGIQRALSVNERLQTALHPWSSYVIVPVFALANAGVALGDGVLGEALRSPVMWGIVLGLVVGKAVGVSVGALGGARLPAGSLPRGVGEGQVVGGAALSGIGFTVSLLVVDLAYRGSDYADAATVGVLLAAVGAFAVGWLAFVLAAAIRGETTASLPMVLDHPVDPERDWIRGPADAPLTLVEYSDFECEFCGYATGVLQELRGKFGDELRYVFRHLPLPDVHAHAELASAAAEAAGRQDAFWEMHAALFGHQNELEYDDVIGYADELGLDVERFMNDLADPAIAEKVREDIASADASGARGTPTFFIGDRRHVGPHDARSLAEALEWARHETRDDLDHLPR